MIEHFARTLGHLTPHAFETSCFIFGGKGYIKRPGRPTDSDIVGEICTKTTASEKEILDVHMIRNLSPVSKSSLVISVK